MISLHFSRHALISLNYRSEKGSESQCRIPFEFIPSERAKEIETDDLPPRSHVVKNANSRMVPSGYLESILKQKKKKKKRLQI